MEIIHRILDPLFAKFDQPMDLDAVRQTIEAAFNVSP